MTKVKAVWNWLRKYWYLPVFAVLAVLSAIFGALVQLRFTNPARTLKVEKNAIDAGANAAKEALESGNEAALTTLEDAHADTLKALDEAQTQKVERLRDDPPALARYLVRMGERAKRSR